MHFDSALPLMPFGINLGTIKPAFDWQAHFGVPIILQDPMTFSMLACTKLRSADVVRLRQAISDWLSLS